MNDKLYVSPEIEAVSVNPEGLLCSSPMQLPNVNWQEDQEW